MMPDSAIQEALKGLDGVLWRETAFADLQWYYAEEGVYIMRCKKGDPNEHLCVIRAKSADDAIARAVFNLHKADEKKKPAPVGDCAKMREALEDSQSQLENFSWGDYGPQVREQMRDNRAALAAPARNCDMPLIMDGPADNNADKAWLVFKRHNPDAYFDVPGLLRCIDWLLAPTTEKQGGAK